MGFFDDIKGGFQSLGHFVDNNVIHPFTNKVLSPVYESILKPDGNIVFRTVREAINISSGVDKMTEVWEKRAGYLTNDTINAVDKGVIGIGSTLQGIGNIMSTPIIPIALGLGAIYIIKK